MCVVEERTTEVRNLLHGSVMCQEGIDRAASMATTDTDISKAPRTLRRTLKATVAAVLAAVAAALLSNSDEVGEWLMVVAPNVMPHAEAGAEMLHKTIEGAKSCYQEGVNVCLDAEGHATALYTYISQWYLSPKQHVIEMAGSILLLVPVVYLYYKVCRTRVRRRRASGTFGSKSPSLVMKLWGAGLLAHVGIGAFLKFTKGGLASHPAYLWQPCHVHSLVMGLCSFIDTDWSLLVMHVATTLWWGPFLAFVAPSLPTDPVEIAIFWGQHTLMLLMPFFRLALGANWLFRDFWWNSVGFLFLTCYHWWWLAPVNIYTGVNVATMSVPPDSLVMFGKYYRPVWGAMCMMLQLLAVLVMALLARMFGQWPSRSTALTPQASLKASSNGHVQVPSDAVSISQDTAVKLVDG